MALTQNAKTILEFLQKHKDEDLTAQDVAESTGLNKKTVDGSFTLVFQKRGYGKRQQMEIELADGSHQTVKFLRLTEAGLKLDPDSADA